MDTNKTDTPETCQALAYFASEDIGPLLETCARMARERDALRASVAKFVADYTALRFDYDGGEAFLLVEELKSAARTI